LLSSWHKPNKWISDPQGYVFLPRAMLEIGKALYPNEWTGAEPVTPVFSRSLCEARMHLNGKNGKRISRFAKSTLISDGSR
jgi:hypothetical protein